MSDELARRNDPFLAKSPVDSITCAPVDDLFPPDWDDAEKAKAVSELGIHDGRVLTGLNKIIPCDCNPVDCLTNKRGLCPLSKKPTGQTCPYERSIIETYVRAYVNELRPEPDEISTISLIRELADTELRIARMSGELANASFLVEKDIFSPNGALLTTELVDNPLYGRSDKLTQKKLSILKSLHATRADRMKGEINEDSDIARVANVMAKIATAIKEGREIDGNADLLPEEDKFSEWFAKQRDGEDVIDAEFELVESEPAEEQPEAEEAE